jgi:hypothetical protein
MNNKTIIIWILFTCISKIELRASLQSRLSGTFRPRSNFASQIQDCINQGKPIDTLMEGAISTYAQKLEQNDNMLTQSLWAFHINLRASLTNLDKPTARKAIKLLDSALAEVMKTLSPFNKTRNLKKMISHYDHRLEFPSLLINMPNIVEDLFTSYLKQYCEKEAIFSNATLIAAQICEYDVNENLHKYRASKVQHILNNTIYKAIIAFLKDLIENYREPQVFLPFLLSSEFLDFFKSKQFLNFINSENFNIVENMLAIIPYLPIKEDNQKALTKTLMKAYNTESTKISL